MFLQLCMSNKSNETFLFREWVTSYSTWMCLFYLHTADAHLMTLFSSEAKFYWRKKSPMTESTSVGYQQLIILPISTWQYQLLETFHLMFFLMTVCLW